MRILTLVLLAGAALLLCQDAKIIIIERSDTNQLKQAYADYKTARDRWEHVKAEVAGRYTKEDGKTMAGWDKVEFSVDFRALVPQRAQYSSLSFYPSILNTGTSAMGTTGTVNAMDLSVNDGIRTDIATKETIHPEKVQPFEPAR